MPQRHTHFGLVGHASFVGRPILWLALAALLVVAAPGSPLAQGRAGERGEAFDEQVVEDEVDPLELAAVLLTGGDAERAVTMLRAISVSKQAEGFDLGRYFTLLGLAELELGQSAQAALALEDAIRHSVSMETVEQLSLLQAQAWYALADYKRAIKALNHAGERADSNPRAHMMRVQAYHKLDDPAGAWEAIEAGIERHPDDIDLRRQEVLLLVELGLYEMALARGWRFLERDAATAEDYVTLAEIMRRAQRFDDALSLLEIANLRFEHHIKLTVLMARTYADKGMPLVSAMLYEEAALQDPSFAGACAEAYRRAGWIHRALHLNALVKDAGERSRQRMSLLIAAGDYEAAAALEPRLSRLGLLRGDENMAYAMAYVLFMTRRYDRADPFLDGISDPEIFANATQLRRQMAICRQDPRSC